MDPHTSEPLFKLEVDYDSGNVIKDLSKWAKFIAIVYLIVLAAAFIGLVVASTALIELIGSYRPEFAGLGSIALAVIIVLIGLYVFTSVQLFRFADMVRKGIDRQDQQLFNAGLKSLKLYLIFMGIISMIWLLIGVLRFALVFMGASFLNLTR